MGRSSAQFAVRRGSPAASAPSRLGGRRLNQRWFPGFSVNANRAVTAADYNTYSITAPPDSRLPNGGGYVIGGLYDLSTTAFGRTDNLVTFADSYGHSVNYWHGVDVNVNARIRGGLTLQGGTSTGRRVTDACDIGRALPGAVLPTGLGGAPGAALYSANTAIPASRCQASLPFITDIRGLAAYTVPKVDLQVSATWQSRSGPELAANWNVPNASIAPTLGRSLSGGRTSTTVNLLEPGQLYGDRISQLDFRVAKIVRFGKARTTVGIDLYNVTNSSATLTYNSTYGTTWLRPNSFMPARFTKVTGQLKF